MADTAEDKKDIATDNAINLKVVGQDGNETFFKCKKTTPFQKLMNAYCTRQGISMNSVRFLFDGERILPTHTPEGATPSDRLHAALLMLAAFMARPCSLLQIARWKMAMRSTL